jgi:hypothetical protein
MVVALTVIVLGPAATAKPGHGPGEEMIRSVAVRGPGISGDYLFTDHEIVQPLAAMTYLEAALGRFVRPSQPPRPSGDLGPRYELESTLGSTFAKDMQLPARIVQRFYPHAPGGPIVFTPDEEGLPVGGWWSVSAPLEGALEDAGLDISDARVPPTPSSSSSNTGTWIVGAILSALLAVALAGIRRGRLAPQRG